MSNPTSKSIIVDALFLASNRTYDTAAAFPEGSEKEAAWLNSALSTALEGTYIFTGEVWEWPILFRDNLEL